MLILEGPHVRRFNAKGQPIMTGLRNYMIVTRKKQAECIGRKADMEHSAAQIFGCRFYPAGSWEIERYENDGWSLVRQDVLAELHGPQIEMDAALPLPCQ